MRSKVKGVQTVQWAPQRALPQVAPALGGRPAIDGARVPLSEGPILGESVFRIGTWDWHSDSAKVAKLRTLAEDYGHDPRLRWWVVNEVLQPAGVQPRDFAGQLRAIFHWVQNNTYYTNESGEHIQSPWWTIRYRTGDCDDQSLLIAAMLTSLAFPFKFALAGKDRTTGKMTRWVEGERMPRSVDFSHIYLFAGDQPFDARGWVAMEPTLRGVPLGYDVVERGLPQGVVAQDMGSSYAGIPDDPRVYLHNIDVEDMKDRAEILDAFRSLPPHEALRAAGPLGFMKDWINWQRTSTSVVEGVIASVLIALVLARVGVHRGGQR